MSNSKSASDFLDRFTQQFGGLAGSGLGTLSTELRQQVQAAARAAFDKMELVPREEFEAHKAVLLRTREKLEQLESQLTKLEAQLADRGNTKLPGR